MALLLHPEIFVLFLSIFQFCMHHVRNSSTRPLARSESSWLSNIKLKTDKCNSMNFTNAQPSTIRMQVTAWTACLSSACLSISARTTHKLFRTPGEILKTWYNMLLLVQILKMRQPVYLDGLPVVVEGGAPIRCVLTVNSAQEIQLDSMLGHPVLELVEELTAAGKGQALLIQLDIKHIFEMKNNYSVAAARLRQTQKRKKRLFRSEPRSSFSPLCAQCGLDTSICQQVKLWVGGPDSPCETEGDNNHTGSVEPSCNSCERKLKTSG